MHSCTHLALTTITWPHCYWCNGIRQPIVAVPRRTRVPCWGIYIRLCYKFPTESYSERISTIGQYLVKLWARVRCPVFFDSRCRCGPWCQWQYSVQSLRYLGEPEFRARICVICRRRHAIHEWVSDISPTAYLMPSDNCNIPFCNIWHLTFLRCITLIFCYPARKPQKC